MSTRTKKQESHNQTGMATVRQAGEYLNLCKQSIYNLINSGKLKSKRIGRARRITWASIHELANADS